MYEWKLTKVFIVKCNSYVLSSADSVPSVPGPPGPPGPPGSSGSSNLVQKHASSSTLLKKKIKLLFSVIDNFVIVMKLQLWCCGVVCVQVTIYKSTHALVREGQRAPEGTLAYVSERGGELYIKRRNSWRKIQVGIWWADMFLLGWMLDFPHSVDQSFIIHVHTYVHRYFFLK